MCGDGRDELLHQLRVGKWIFVWVVVAEAVGIAFALVMFLMGKVEGQYDNLTADEAQSLHTVELNQIKTGMSNKNVDRGSNRRGACPHSRWLMPSCTLNWIKHEERCRHWRRSGRKEGT